MPDHTIAENLTRLQTARTDIASAITTKGGTVASGAGFEDFPTAIGTIPTGGSATLITKSITENGTYNASSDSADGYSSVTVAVPNTYSAGDEGKVVSNGALVAQTARPDTITTNGNYITTNYNSVTVNVPSGGDDSIESTKAHTAVSLDVAEPYWGTCPTSLRRNGNRIWTDGTNVYFSETNTQEVLIYTASSGPTFSSKTWNISNLNASSVWTDGTDIYYSDEATQIVLDKSTSTWSIKTWTGLTNFYGYFIWTDGTDIYYSGERSGQQYVLDKSTSTWSSKTWTGLTSFPGNFVWTDGTDIYYSNGPNHYVLDKSTSTWSTKTWSGLTIFEGINVWTDGKNIYYSYGTKQYVLDKTTSTWSTKTWTGTPPYFGSQVWTDGINIYHGYESNSTYGRLVNPIKTKVRL